MPDDVPFAEAQLFARWWLVHKFMPLLCAAMCLFLPRVARPADVISTVASGAWSDPAVWSGGRVPGTNSRVLVRARHAVQYDVNSDTAIRLLKVAGTLQFATDRDTQLDVGLLRVEAGEDLTEEGFDCTEHSAPMAPDGARPTLTVGTARHPVDAGHTALVRLVYFDGMDKESCPAIVCCGGRMEFHGAPMNRTWVKLAATAKDGVTEVELAEPVTGWRAGDRVLIPTTAGTSLFEFRDKERRVIPTVRDRSHSEEHTIKSIDGNKLLLAAPLAHRHRCEGEFRGEVANLSRNVIVESADPQGVRGHTMYHANSQGSISYAEFRHLGKKGVLGRYSLHFHLCRDSMRGASVVGASIHDSDNRWLTVHGTDYLLVRDCVGYNSRGHGFFLEDGTEVFNVFDRNLAVQALHAAPLPKQMLPYDENEGAGFWWANSLNTFTRNVAAECDQYGFRFEATQTPDFSPVLAVPQAVGTLRQVDIRTLPFVRFDDNEAHSQRRFALNLGGIRHISDAEDYRMLREPNADLSRIQGGDVQGVGPDTRHPFIIRNWRVWESQWVFHGGSPSVLIDGIEAIDCTYGIFKTRMDAHEYRKLNMKRIDTADIFEPWGNSTLAEDYERYLDEEVDDLPPTTVITGYEVGEAGHLTVRGIVADNGVIKRVTVNGHEARPLVDGAGLENWQIALPIPSSAQITELLAVAEDKKGNVEPRPHRVTVHLSPEAALSRRASAAE